MTEILGVAASLRALVSLPWFKTDHLANDK